MKKLKNFFNKSYTDLSKYKNSYSQYGEDQIILTLLFLLQLKDVNFIDIGANNPFDLNNTALLNEKGIYGINIEPDPEMFKKLENVRIKDTNLNIGIGSKDSVLKYYRFSDTVYNTFSESEYLELLKRPELKYISNLDVKVNTYNQVVKKYLDNMPPTILFIDTEGFDEVIIDSIDYNAYSPIIICIETFAYGKFEKNHSIIEKVKNYGYSIHADTFVNTIFVKDTFLPFKKL